jgi:hypothetical protein
MLLDVLTLTIILRAKDHIAAKQFLRELTYRPQYAEVEGVSDYPKTIVLKAVAICGGSSHQWLEGVFDG